MTDKAKILEKVRALLAKADSTDFPGEADVFRAKADDLMMAYAIEQWQVDQSQSAAGAKPVPECRDFDFAWFFDSDRHDELWDLFRAVAYHCRCVVATRGFGRNGATTSYMPVIGLPSDMDYFDMLFTHLMLQMGKGLEPKPVESNSMMENLVLMKEAGVKWQRIHELLVAAGQMPDEPWSRKIGIDFTKRYAAYCKEQGLEQHRVFPSVWQRSFAIGFVSEVRERFAEMRKQDDKGSGGMELVVRDIREAARDMYDEMFPRDKRNRGNSVSREYKLDGNAYRRGRTAGEKADLSGKASSRISNRKELKR